MAYAGVAKRAIGELRRTLSDHGITMASPEFRSHGKHEIAADAPLVLVACSGGRDSLALVATARIVCESWGLRCMAVVVDHQLQDGSANVARAAVRACEELGVQCLPIRTVQVEHTSAGLEADARDARYKALVEAAQSCDARCVLLAHTQDDVAETVLMSLMRSPSLESLTGIAADVSREGVLFLRPFLGLTREHTTQLCELWGITWWDDPTNGQDAEGTLDFSYPLRSRVRHDLIPVLEQLSGKNVRALLADACDDVRDDIDIIEQAVSQAYEKCVSIDAQAQRVCIDVRGLTQQLPGIQRRVVRRALGDLSHIWGEDTTLTQTRFMVSEVLRVAGHVQKKMTVSIKDQIVIAKARHVIQLCKYSMYADF